LVAAYRDNSKETPGVYEGYTSCPIYVGDNKLMLAEFKYGVP